MTKIIILYDDDPPPDWRRLLESIPPLQKIEEDENEPQPPASIPPNRLDKE